MLYNITNITFYTLFLIHNKLSTLKYDGGYAILNNIKTIKIIRYRLG